MARDDRPLESAQEIFLEHILGLGRGTDIAYILRVLGVEIPPLYPALAEAELLEPSLDNLVGVDMMLGG